MILLKISRDKSLETKITVNFLQISLMVPCVGKNINCFCRHAPCYLEKKMNTYNKGPTQDVKQYISFV